LFALEITFFDCLSFVVVLLSLTEGDDKFYVSARREEFGWDDRHSLLLGGFELFDLAVFGEELAWFVIDRSGVGCAFFVVDDAKTGVVEPELTTFDIYVAPFELNMAEACCAHFFAAEAHAHDQISTELVVITSAAVYDGWRWASLLFHKDYCIRGDTEVMCYAISSMDIGRYRDELEAIIPGALDAYESLKAKNGMGIFTSNGAFYNHTFFARDASMASKFVADFDHQVTKDTIVALAALQGTEEDKTTNEEPGRIHHEFRDFTTWQGGGFEKFALKFFARRWGVVDNQMLTYYAADTTALYIRLINKYVTHVDKSFLDVVVKNRRDGAISIRDSLALAADWLMTQVDEHEHFVSTRHNEWSLPYQTFQDSSTAYPRQDGTLANFRRGITYTEIQAFVIDALEDVTRLLEDHERRHEWQRSAHAMRKALLRDFWSEKEQFFGSAFDQKGLVDMPNISAGWTLNTGLWDEVDDEKREEVIGAIVRRLFSDDFLTPVGMRSRSLHADQPLPGVVEYHGRLTVWPMFNFMVIEGLRRHRLHRLAGELENRLINGINASGTFEEYLAVDGGGHLLRSVPGKKADVAVDAQMLPEKRIAFTVIPAIVLAYRATNRGRAWPQPGKWQKKLEDEILKDMTPTERLIPEQAIGVVTAVVPTKFRRLRGNVRSAWYFLNERRKM